MELLSRDMTTPNGVAQARPHWRHHRPQAASASRVYAVRHRLHESRTTYIPASELVATVSTWLAEVGARSPLVEALAQAVDVGDWPAAHSISECLGIEVTVVS
jgi:hypothetical protein